MYDFELKRINQEIRKRKARRVLIQLPEGLKSEFLKIADKVNAECVLSGDPCFGACDIQTHPECDLTVHFGHSKMLDRGSVIYVECHSDLDISKVVKKAIKVLEGKRIGLLTTVQHINELEKAKKILAKAGKKAVVGGQVLGCEASNAKKIADKVDEFLFIGSGMFHGIGIMHATGRRVLLADPYTGIVQGVDPMKSFKEKHLRKAKAMDAREFGVVVCSKPGQKNVRSAELVKNKLEKSGKRAHLVFINEITPDKLDYLPFDAFVITACPRIVIDDWKNYKKPVLLPGEV
jgi:2-(3-amino-3-carboxypropyl)histidine synthase